MWYLLKLLLWGSVLLVVLVGPGIVFLNLDPLNTLLQCNSRIWNFILQLIRILLVYSLATEMLKSAFAFIIVGLIVMQSVSQGAILLREILKFKTSSSPMVVLCSAEIQLYRELQVWIQYVNAAFCYRSVPPLLFCGVSMTIVAIYGTIRMYVWLPILVYPLLPATTVLGVSFLITLLPQAAEGYEKSIEFVDFTRRKCTVKYEKKVAKSLRPNGARCGPFGMISNKWTTRVADSMADSTVTLLLTF